MYISQNNSSTFRSNENKRNKYSQISMNNFSQRVSFYLSTFKYKNVNAKNKTKENKTKRKKNVKWRVYEIQKDMYK